MSGIFEKLAFYFQYPFVWYALIVGVLIALCSSLLGVTLVLKRFSFIGDGLSHVAFGAMAIASVLNFSNNMLFVMPVTVICAVLLLRTGNRHDFCGCSGCWLSADECIFHRLQYFWRCVQQPVWFHFHSDTDRSGGVAVRDCVCNRGGTVCGILS